MLNTVHNVQHRSLRRSEIYFFFERDAKARSSQCEDSLRI